MDEQNRPTPADNNPPGAPELGKGVTPPSAPLVEDKFTGPVFRAQPINPSKSPAPVPVAATSPRSADTDEPDNDEDGEVDEHQARIEYLRSLRPDSGKKRRRSKGKLLLITVLIVVLLAAGGASAYYFMGKKSSGTTKQPAKTAATTNTDQTSNEPAANSDQSSAAETKTYNSQTFGMSIAYPGDWTPAETKDKLTITSPVVKLTDATSQTKSGRLVLTVRARQDKPVEFTGGAVVAVLDSDKVDYTKPTSTQRGSTYLSYLQFATTTTKGGLDGVYITGDYGYKYGQTVRLAEISKVDPLVNVTFVSCADETCADSAQAPMTISSTAWKSDTANRTVVETMLKSLTLN